jgi:methylglutaconyl-CoA hydratase
VLELATTLKANSPESQSATKQLLAAQNKAWLDIAIKESLATQANSRRTRDFQEGVAAFLEKRAPAWKIERQ